MEVRQVEKFATAPQDSQQRRYGAAPCRDSQLNKAGRRRNVLANRSSRRATIRRELRTRLYRSLAILAGQRHQRLAAVVAELRAGDDLAVAVRAFRCRGLWSLLLRPAIRAELRSRR